VALAFNEIMFKEGLRKVETARDAQNNDSILIE
jgi:hypothetical protein